MSAAGLVDEMDAVGVSGRTGTALVERAEAPERADAATLTASVPSASKLPLWASVRVAEVSPAEMLPALVMVTFGTVVTGMKLDVVALFRKLTPSSETVTVAPSRVASTSGEGLVAEMYAGRAMTLCAAWFGRAALLRLMIAAPEVLQGPPLVAMALAGMLMPSTSTSPAATV